MARLQLLACPLVVIALVAGCGGGGGGEDGGGPPITRTLSVTIGGGGSGTVTSAPAGISCTSGTCSATFSQDAIVSLTASPTGGSTFAGWSGACTMMSGPCNVTLAGDTAVTATFNPATAPVTLSVTLEGSGTGKVTSAPPGIDCSSGTCTADFAAGTDVTLTASTTFGSTFAGWDASGPCGAAGTGPCTLTLGAAASVTGTFDPPVVMRSLSVFTSGSGSGHVVSSSGGIDCPGTCSASYADGTVVTLTASPTVSGSYFSAWTGACAGEATTVCALTMNGDASTTAQFKQGRQLIVSMLQDGTGTVTSDPAGIDCTSGASTGCSMWVDEGATVTLTATTATGTTFLGWGDPCWGTVAPCAVAMSTNDWTLTADFSLWKVRRPFPTSIASAAVLGTTMIAVGSGDAWLTSSDGVSWTGHELPFGTPALRGVAAGGATAMAVAVGDGGTIYSTTDPGAWTPQASGISTNLHAVAWCGSAWVAVGAGGVVLSSADGATWTPRTSNTVRDLLAVTCGSGTFAATGLAGTARTSTDGQAWASPVTGTTEKLTGVAFGTSGFVAVGSNGAVVTSPDGGSWTSQAVITATDLMGVAVLGSSYVAVDGQKNAFVSLNGTAWSKHTYTAPENHVGVAALAGELYALGQGGGLARSTTGGLTWTTALAPAGVQLYDSAWGGGRYVVTGHHGTIFSSPDGAVWTSRRAGTDEWVASVTYDGSAFIAVAGGGILRSLDGDGWTKVADAPGPYGGAVQWVSGKGFVVAGMNGLDTVVLTSPDGTSGTWTTRATITGVGLVALEYGNSVFLGLGSGGEIYSHADPSNGTSWIEEAGPTPGWLGSLAFGNGLFVATDAGVGKNSYTSTDGILWTPHTSADSVQNVLAFGDGVFRTSGTTSVDGATWTPATIPTVPGESIGFERQLETAVYGGPAGWVTAKALSSTTGSANMFATHP